MKYFEEIPANELYHHGILGQKWGIRRYQNKDGTLTPLGKKHWNKISQEAKNKEKERIVKSGDLVELNKHREEFEPNEINSAITNFDLNQKMKTKIKDLKKSDYEKGKEAFNKMIEKGERISNVMKTTANIVSNTTDAYNKTAKVTNAFGFTDLPIIGESKDKPKKKYSLKELQKLNLDDINLDEMQDMSKYTEARKKVEDYLKNKP